MIELVAELLFEGVLQVVFEVFGESAFRLLSTRTGRLVAGALTGFGGGWLWGRYLAAHGHEATPRTLWVSLAFAVVGVVAGWMLRQAAAPGAPDPGFHGSLLPWRWSPRQWDTFAVLNAFVALGVFVAFRSAT